MNGILGIPGFQSGYMQAYGPSNYSLPYTSAIGQTPYTMGNSFGGGGILDFSSYLQPFQAQRQQWQDDPSQTFQPYQPEPEAPTGGMTGPVYQGGPLNNIRVYQPNLRGGAGGYRPERVWAFQEHLYRGAGDGR